MLDHRQRQEFSFDRYSPEVWGTEVTQWGPGTEPR